jgi:hypothetical protein
MDQQKLDKLWQNIEADLQLTYSENNREALLKAILELPEYKAPEKVWTSIDMQLTKNSVRISWKKYLSIAAMITVILSLAYLFQTKWEGANSIQYTQVPINSYDISNLADTNSTTFNDLKSITCNIQPSYCTSSEFMNYESEYNELLNMQESILQKASLYDGGEHLENMLLKIESRKKDIEQELIAKLNS